MSELLVVAFPSVVKAEMGGNKVLSMARENLLVIEDAVLAAKTGDGILKLDQVLKPSEFWEIRAAASGNPAPVSAGALTNFGSDDSFLKEAVEIVPPGSAALFVLVSNVTSDQVVEALRAAGGTVLRTVFNKSSIQTIRTALAG